MKAIRFRAVETIVAAIGPTGVAFQIHQTVATFQSMKVSVAHPNIDHHPRREFSIVWLIHSRGTNATKRPMPDRPSHPAESRTTERSMAISRFVRIAWGGLVVSGKSSQSSAERKAIDRNLLDKFHRVACFRQKGCDFAKKIVN